MFLMWEVRSCSDTLPELGRIISVPAARRADGEDAGRVYYDTIAGDNGKRRLIREGGGGSPLESVVMFGPGTQEGEQYHLFPHNG